MVVALGPGKFYGSSLPRPRIYTDVKFNSFRVDPPVPVTDPFMSWAEEAHWSMGGLSLQRHRLQGRIEGSVEKLRNQIEKSIKAKESLSPRVLKRKFVTKPVEEESGKTTKSVEKKKKKNVNGGSPSPPPAPMANKRRRYVGLIDEEEEVEGTPAVRKWPVRKLSDEFDLVSKKSPARRSGSVEVEMETVASRTRGKKTVIEEAAKTVSKGKKRLRKIGEDNNGGGASPRLVKGR